MGIKNTRFVSKYKGALIAVFMFIGLLSVSSINVKAEDTMMNDTTHMYNSNEWSQQGTNQWNQNMNNNYSYNGSNWSHQWQNNNWNNQSATNASWGSNQNNWNNQPHVVYAQPPQIKTGPEVTNTMTGQTTGITTTVQNVSSPGFNTKVCMEEVDAAGVSHNNGCVPQVTFSDAAQGPSTFTFNSWPTPNNYGERTVYYTYQSPDGQWHKILTPTYNDYGTNISS